MSVSFTVYGYIFMQDLPAVHWMRSVGLSISCDFHHSHMYLFTSDPNDRKTMYVFLSILSTLRVHSVVRSVFTTNCAMLSGLFGSAVLFFCTFQFIGRPVPFLSAGCYLHSNVIVSVGITLVGFSRFYF